MPVLLKIPNVKCQYLTGQEVEPNTGKYWYCNSKEEFICPGIAEQYLCLKCTVVGEKDMESTSQNIRKALEIITS